jgi:hypothetical protein
MEVRPLSEILATLDAQASLEGMPFMPEMARYCSRRFQVYKSAHKTCDPTGCTNMRRMENAVHLSLRCDGSGHDGCQAACLLFWKTDWLRPVTGPSADAPIQQCDAAAMERLNAATRYMHTEEIRYRCQATEIVRASREIPSHDRAQYAEDLRSGNVSPADFMRYFGVAAARSLASKLARRLRLPARTARANVAVARIAASPSSASSQILPGEIVRVRPAREIAGTLDAQGKNRGLRFEDEMLRHCGRPYRVQSRVREIIDEKTGRKIRLGGDCIVLEEVQCDGTYNSGRLFCPRSPYYYWRAAWLNREAEERAPQAQEGAPPPPKVRGLQEAFLRIASRSGLKPMIFTPWEAIRSRRLSSVAQSASDARTSAKSGS